ncbi:class I SAM-dependent methyltransferase [Pedobacter boryungensis]|uniref:Class I SAM-dependent methyltransferase n=1 Tax=Pedobacter boryungensis TaxID=869962 RepID=A0ABX2DF98_9SPHI|nr:class I SAM-dependent methyltransferase [Pedobacter boryungensis]NQX32759.1 class I SAM-dependent methyltransferase [Pedobacter boryungensis]
MGIAAEPVIKTCIICNSTDVRVIYNTYDRHYGNTDKYFQVAECNSCGLLFLNPMITSDELHSMYDEDTYYSYQQFNDGTEKKSLRQKLGKLLLNTEPKDLEFNCAGKEVLDIGCGSGEKLYDYMKKGAKVSGVEISKSGADFGNTYGLKIFNGILNEARFESDKFDYIRSNHSFEHLINPIETTEEIYRIAKPGGKVFIGVPNTKSIPYFFFKKYWYYLGIPFHPINYNPKNLILLFESKGFKMEKVNYNGNVNGVLGSIQIFLNRNNKKSSSEGWLVNNLILKVITHQIAKFLNVIKLGDCIEIIFVK